MAIAFDAATEKFEGATVSPLSWSHTCTGSNLVLIVGISYTPTTTISSVTYNGAAMTLIGSSGTVGIIGVQVALYYINNPSTGANNVSVSFGGTSQQIAWRSSASYTGANQTSAVINASVFSTDSATTTHNATLTTTVADCWQTGFFVGSQPPTVGTGTTQRAYEALGNGICVDNNANINPAGSNTIQVTSASGSYGWGSAAILPLVTAGNVVHYFNLLGVGA